MAKKKNIENTENETTETTETEAPAGEHRDRAKAALDAMPSIDADDFDIDAFTDAVMKKTGGGFTSVPIPDAIDGKRVLLCTTRTLPDLDEKRGRAVVSIIQTISRTGVLPPLDPEAEPEQFAEAQAGLVKGMETWRRLRLPGDPTQRFAPESFTADDVSAMKALRYYLDIIGYQVSEHIAERMKVPTSAPPRPLDDPANKRNKLVPVEGKRKPVSMPISSKEVKAMYAARDRWYAACVLDLYHWGVKNASAPETAAQFSGYWLTAKMERVESTKRAGEYVWNSRDEKSITDKSVGKPVAFKLTDDEGDEDGDVYEDDDEENEAASNN